MAYAASLAGSKLRAQLGSSLNEQVSAPTSDFAQNQLKKLGWSEGTGLGKRRQGRATHISVKRRQDNVGLGHKHTTPHNTAHRDQWWKGSMGDTLAKLSSKKKKDSSSRKKKRKKTSRREYTDEELFEATGGARFGMRAQRRATGKWARAESQSEADEQEARARVEWNGRGAAQTLLIRSSDNDSSSDSNKHNLDDAGDSREATLSEENPSEKSVPESDESARKLRKREKKDKKRSEKESMKKKKRKKTSKKGRET